MSLEPRHHRLSKMRLIHLLWFQIIFVRTRIEIDVSHVSERLLAVSDATLFGVATFLFQIVD